MKIKNIIIVFSSILTLCSCGNFLEEYSQDHDYVRSWNDLNELLLGDCYMPVNSAGLFKNDNNLGTFIHLLSDDVDEDATPGMDSQGYDIHTYEFGYLTWQERVGANADFSNYFTENKTWTAMYKYINVANNVLESAEKVPQALDKEKSGVNYVKAQAHFLRGFYYFWLTNMYGQPYKPSTASTDLGVPIKISSEVLDIKYSRNTVAECYQLIEDDLLAAEKEFRGVTDITRKSIYRADSSSVQLLLSRFYLYKQDWEKAAQYARKVIKVYPDLQNLSTDNSFFAAKDNPETIFSMGGDDIPCLFWHGAQGVTLTMDLYNSYSNNDLRKTQWLWSHGEFVGCTKQEEHQFTLGGDPYTKENINYYNMGWHYSSGIQFPISSLFWLRAGEAYLNLAEAEAYQGHDSEAKEALNELRAARYAANASDMEISSTGSQLISDIRKERRRELVCEGQRWFDLRRYRVCSVQPEKKSITHHFSIYDESTSTYPIETRTYVLPEDDPSWTMAIPHEVIEFNTGMDNNGNQRRLPEGGNTEENK